METVGKMNLVKVILLLFAVCVSAAKEESKAEMQNDVPYPHNHPDYHHHHHHHEDQEEIKELLEKNTEELDETNKELNEINIKLQEIKEISNEQKEQLKAIGFLDELLVKHELFIEANSEVLRTSLKNVSEKVDVMSEKVLNELLTLQRLQRESLSIIINLDKKIDAYQAHLINSARGIDAKVLDLTKLVAATVLPKLDNLKCTFNRLETAQVNIEVELKTLSVVKDISIDSNIKLGNLEQQLRELNRTQEDRLNELEHDIRHLEPINTYAIEKVLRELILSQKRVELDLELCGKHPHHLEPHPEPNTYPQIYEPIAPPPKLLPLPGPAKQLDLMHVYDIKHPNQKEEYSEHYYANAYSQAPKPRHEIQPKPSNYAYNGQPIKTKQSVHAVSQQEPMPWEVLSLYQPPQSSKQYVPASEPPTYEPNAQSPGSYSHAGRYSTPKENKSFRIFYKPSSESSTY